MRAKVVPQKRPIPSNRPATIDEQERHRFDRQLYRVLAVLSARTCKPVDAALAYCRNAVGNGVSHRRNCAIQSLAATRRTACRLRTSLAGALFRRKNDPARWRYPLWSLASDIRMTVNWLNGDLWRELRTAVYDCLLESRV